MIETWQVLLISVVTVLTILLTVIGVQVVYILKEVREAMRKVNKMADDAAGITRGLSKSLGSIAGMGAFAKVAASLLKLLKQKMDEHNGNDYSVEEEEDREEEKEESTFRKAANRVFRKNGKPLT